MPATTEIVGNEEDQQSTARNTELENDLQITVVARLLADRALETDAERIVGNRIQRKLPAFIPAREARGKTAGGVIERQDAGDLRPEDNARNERERSAPEFSPGSAD